MAADHSLEARCYATPSPLPISRRGGSGAGSRSALRLNALLGDERFIGALARVANPSDDIEVVASDEDQRGCSRVVLLDSLPGSQTAEAEGVREVLQDSAGKTPRWGSRGLRGRLTAEGAALLAPVHHSMI